MPLMKDQRSIGLAELARETDVTVRTIRYYITQGLLPSPIGQGPSAHYTDSHADRIRLIKVLQKEHLPLAQIRARLDQLDDQQVRRALDEAELGHMVDAATRGGAPGAAGFLPGASALEYIRRVLREGSGRGPARSFRPMTPADHPQPPAQNLMRPVRSFGRDVPDEYPLPGESGRPRHDPPAPSNVPSPFPSRSLPMTDRSTWEHITLAPDFELHVRRPLDRHANRQLERLLDYARELFADRER
jgi:DNA-binding transcriptional MerR regulator